MRASPLIRVITLLGVGSWLATAALAQRPRFDVLITNGRIVDGTGAPWFRGDVGIEGDRITAVGALTGATATTVVDAAGLVVAPGFIDLLGQSEFNVLVDARAASKIRQGVTTEITGEGSSIAPVNDRMIQEGAANAAHYGIAQDWRTLGDYFHRLEQQSHPAINVGTFVGAGTLRNYVIGKDDRPATAAELERMKQLAAEAMEQGALGVSTSLQYVPDRFASTDEIVELAKVAARYGGVYFTHQRSEGARIFESLDEVFAIAERASIPAEIWHLKTAYKANFGKMPEVLRRIEAARARGLDVTADQYPYTRASNGLDSCLPLWVREGGIEKTISRLRDPATRERVKREMIDPNATTWENQWYGSNGGDGVMLSSVLNDDLRKYEGMTLTAIGKAMGKDPRDAVMDLVIADRGESAVITSIMDENDVRAALKNPLVGVGTDSGARAEDGKLAGSKSHPRGWGSFPRILGQYVRDEHLLPLEEAIRKMTSKAAIRVHINDRGILRPGMMADITIFDPLRVRDAATFNEPNHYAVGIQHVFVNGRRVVANGAITDERPGRPLRGPGSRQSSVARLQSPVNSRQSPVDSRQSPVNSRQSPVNSRQSTVDSRQSAVDSLQLPVDAPQSSAVDNLQSPVDGPQSSVISRQAAVAGRPSVVAGRPAAVASQSLAASPQLPAVSRKY